MKIMKPAKTSRPKLLLTFLATIGAHTPAHSHESEQTEQRPAKMHTVLCISEKVAFVSKSSTGQISADSGLNEQRYIVSPENGLQEFGTNVTLLDGCHYDQAGLPITCHRNDHLWAGEFTLSDDMVFTKNGLDVDSTTGLWAWYYMIGRCSKID